ncbi:hypothetical protein AWC23_14870 [Mycobacterium saskatchewanense]|uniref:Uncharacterized protein n=2 Tax=Mycobacterium saskatchewanense TaxID=220927 RepID=A0AAJ3NQ13_9MYCO|nr:hypothetical protein [Mycobacterium saskatchewanense]ORW71171.1 hypothetical protein AWC23_14870 [Mycobacterium saskatchewanense]
MPSTPRYPAARMSPQPAEDTESGPEPTPPRPQEGHGLGMAKLTDDDVRAIRAEYATGKWDRADLAYIYSVGVGAIGAVLSGRSYTHVTRGRTWKHAADDTKPTPTEQDS